MFVGGMGPILMAFHSEEPGLKFDELSFLLSGSPRLAPGPVGGAMVLHGFRPKNSRGLDLNFRFS